MVLKIQSAVSAVQYDEIVHYNNGGQCHVSLCAFEDLQQCMQYIIGCSSFDGSSRWNNKWSLITLRGGCP